MPLEFHSSLQWKRQLADIDLLTSGNVILAIRGIVMNVPDFRL